MNKKLITVLMTATLSVAGTHTVIANTKPMTVAILDTSINSNLKVFKGKIIQEVCILESNSCPNGTNFMQGKKAANMPPSFMVANGFDHGTKMAHASILTNPDIKIIFIRIIGSTPTGARQLSNEDTFVKALNWVFINKDKFNIQAVALSQSHHNLMFTQNYCPETPNTVNAIYSLDSAGVPVFIAAGNMSDRERISWPACINYATAVSATSISDEIASYSNYDSKLTDMFANGRLRLINPSGYFFNEDGTSVSTQIAAAVYVGLKNKYPSYTKQQVLDLMKSKSYPLKNKIISGYIVGKDILND